MKRLILLTLPALLAACTQGGNIKGVKTFQNEGGAHQPGRVA